MPTPPTTPPADSVRDGYQDAGVPAYYARHAHDYANPHEPVVAAAIAAAVRHWPTPPPARILDLAAGSGEATRALLALGHNVTDAADPYTAPAYVARTGRPCHPWTFEDIAAGLLDGRHYDLVVCSYAMHLVADSRLAGLAIALARLTPALLIITPHKRPMLRREWGWQLIADTPITAGEPTWHRARARGYASPAVAASTLT